MKKYLVLSLVLLIGFASFSCKEKPKDEGLTVQSFFGDVKISTGKGEVIPQIGDRLNQGDTIITGKASILDVTYSQNGIIRINENSTVKVTLLESEAAGGSTRLDMSQGKVFVTISKLIKGRKFEIGSPTSVAAVRGTTFRVTADDKSSRIDVLNGKIAVNPVKEGKQIEGVEKVVEMNTAVVIDEKVVKDAVEKKKEIEVVILKPEEVKEIREEVKDLKPTEKMDEATKTEIKDIVLEPKADLEAEKKKEEDQKLQEKKRQEEGTRLKKMEKTRLAKEIQEKLAKERIEKERIEKEKQEKARIEQKKQETKEKRVKNIPNL
jgi:hypothetical protein